MKGKLIGCDGVWSKSQLTLKLQSMIAKYRNNFEGKPVSTEGVELELVFYKEITKHSIKLTSHALMLNLIDVYSYECVINVSHIVHCPNSEH